MHPPRWCDRFLPGTKATRTREVYLDGIFRELFRRAEIDPRVKSGDAGSHHCNGFERSAKRTSLGTLTANKPVSLSFLFLV